MSFLSHINSLLSSKLGQKLSGNPSVVDYVKKQDIGKVKRIKYNINTKSIGYCFQNGSLVSVDFFFSPKFTPDSTIHLKGISVTDIIDPIVSAIQDERIQGSTEVLVLKGKLHEAASISPSWDFGKYVEAIPERSSVHSWLAMQVKTDERLQNLVVNRKIKDLYPVYKAWAEKFAGKLQQRVYGPGAFRNYIVEGFINSGFGEVRRVDIVPSSEEETIVSSSDEKKWDELRKSFRLTPEQVYSQFETYIKSVAHGDAFSLICSSHGGLGKTYTVTNVLNSIGFSEVNQEIEDEEEHDEENAPVLKNNQYLVITGKLTPYGAYSLMYEYNGDLIVFDDCDTLFQSEDGENLIKAATDDKLERRLGLRTKQTMSDNSEIPKSFPYSGRVIFLTNVPISDIDSAIRSRALIVNIDLTAEESIERVRTLLPSLMKDTPQATMAIKTEVLDFLLTIKTLFTVLDFRTFQQAVKEKLRENPHWKKIVANSIMLKNE